jgi:hypothetical protein
LNVSLGCARASGSKMYPGIRSRAAYESATRSAVG